MDAVTLPHDLLGLCAVVLLLGLRHGFDADHLSTIDALTRHHLQRGEGRARWVGALFSLGHGAVVVVVALGVSLLASHWQVPAWLMSFGAWTSIMVLVLLAGLNIASLRRTPHHEHACLVGLRGRWFGAAGRGGMFAAAAIGALFALSFDTLSLAALVAVSASQHGGWQGALQCALVFTLGMLAVDGLNGLWITRLLRRSDRSALVASRWMGWAVVAVSLLTAALGAAGQLTAAGVALPELLPGSIVVGVLLLASTIGRIEADAATAAESRPAA
ncbi:MAG: nickel transporter [Burkholderiales bacterium]